MSTPERFGRLLVFAFGIVEQSASVILPRTFYALHDTWTPVKLSTITLIVNILLMNVLVKPFAQGGLALAISLSGIVNMLLLLYFLKQKIGLIDGRRILTSLIKIIIASIIMGIVVLLVYHFTLTLTGPNILGAVLNLVIGIFIGVVIYLFLAILLRMEEMKFILQITRRRISS